ncbi:MAG: hypothetical protein RLZZ224_727 [Verrucomicrobiota bacterium]|jgi:hypothetical protein
MHLVRLIESKSSDQPQAFPDFDSVQDVGEAVRNIPSSSAIFQDGDLLKKPQINPNQSK